MSKTLAMLATIAALSEMPIITKGTIKRDYVPSTISAKERKKRNVRNKMQKQGRSKNRK